MPKAAIDVAHDLISLMKKEDAKKSTEIEEQDRQIALLKWKLKELEDNCSGLRGEQV